MLNVTFYGIFRHCDQVEIINSSLGGYKCDVRWAFSVYLEIHKTSLNQRMETKKKALAFQTDSSWRGKCDDRLIRIHHNSLAGNLHLQCLQNHHSPQHFPICGSAFSSLQKWSGPRGDPKWSWRDLSLGCLAICQPFHLLQSTDQHQIAFELWP